MRELTVVEASHEVYEVFDATGFTQIIDVQKARRRLSVEGCPVIGQGAEGTVYRLGPETIVKVYREGTDINTVLNEKRRAQTAFLEGIPTAISYDVVDVDGCAGVVYELLDARNLAELVESEPDSHCFTHGDAHVGNVMVQGDEMLFIDMAHIGMGHPVFDLMSMFLLFKQQAKRRLEKGTLTLEERYHVWDVFLRTYLDTDDEALLAKAEGQVATFACARLLTAALFLPGVVPPEEIEGLKAVPIAAYDKSLELLCF